MRENNRSKVILINQGVATFIRNVDSTGLTPVYRPTKDVCSGNMFLLNVETVTSSGGAMHYIVVLYYE